MTVLVLVACVAASQPRFGQRERPAGADEQILQHARLVASDTHVELYQHGVRVDPAFLKLAESAYARLEGLIGRPYDTRTLGRKMRIVVSDAVTISHVWRGYDFAQDPRGIVFLNPRVYVGALRGSNATYAHEMAHLFSWRFKSHTLREGLADYLALQIHPGAAVGPNVEGDLGALEIPKEVKERLGTTKPPPDWLTSDIIRRRAYYSASYVFVKHLVELGGMEKFLKLYESGRPEKEIAALYGQSREELIRAAGL
jgi:hypothetical protein